MEYRDLDGKKEDRDHDGRVEIEYAVMCSRWGIIIWYYSLEHMTDEGDNANPLSLQLPRAKSRNVRLLVASMQHQLS